MSLVNRQMRNCVLHFTKKLQVYPQVQVPVLAPGGPVFRNAQHFPEKVALRDGIASYTYANLFMSANELSKDITKFVDGKTNQKVLFMCPNDANYVITLWAIWMSGQIAVPVSPLHPKNILLYYANDSSSKLIVSTSEYADLMQRVSKVTQSTLYVLDDKMKLNSVGKKATVQSDMEGGLPLEFYETANALMLYTSGTTGSPKGVMLSHRNLQSQITTLLDAWKWSTNDVLLHTLPLHHVHGIVNALLCPLYIGAKTIMLKRFNANAVWSYLLGVGAKPDERKINVYMAVPTIYAKLIDEYRRVFKNDPKMVEYIRNTLKNKMRLMVSGSAPLRTSVYEKWLEISGHRLLERYGMTETGMVFSNVYDSDREPGYVGVPLPGISVRLVEEDEETKELKNILECTNIDGEVVFTNKLYKSENHKGELLVRGKGVFSEYYNRPEATSDGFTVDGWFKTGDICEYSSEKKKFKMLGRKSVDIINSGGYKISALDVESQLCKHPEIRECVVVGIDDEKYGQKVVAIIVPVDRELTLKEIKDWALDKMPKYWIPSMLKLVDSIPRNAMGKVNKKELITLLF